MTSFIAIPQQAYRNLRAYLSRWPWLRTNWYFGVALIEAALDGSRRSRLEYTREFRQPDPYGLESPRERKRHETALRMLDEERADRRFTRALEIGCAEGHFTVLLQPRCESLVAADLCPPALQRARARCATFRSVALLEWDVRCDSVPGSFQLIAIMCVLDCFRSRRAIALVRSKLVAALEPGGYLLVSSVRTPAWMESSWWAGWFVRGGVAIDQFIAAHPALERVSTCTESWYMHSLFQKKPQ